MKSTPTDIQALGCDAASLAAFQRRLAGAIDGQEPDVLRSIRVSAVGSPAAAVAVYRDSSRAIRQRALENVYPVCAEILGNACFGGIGAELVRVQPSRSPDLTDFAKHFPDHLQRLLSADRIGPGFEYLPDLARLELAIHQVLFAPAAPVWDQAAFARAARSETDRIRLYLAPATLLLASTWPVHAIWLSHRDRGVLNEVDVGDGDRLVIYRSGLRPTVRRVSDPVFRLVRAIAAGATLSALAAAGHEVERLGELIRSGIVTGFDLAPAVGAD